MQSSKTCFSLKTFNLIKMKYTPQQLEVPAQMHGIEIPV